MPQAEPEVSERQTGMSTFRIKYQGWSGCLLDSTTQPKLPLLAFDPAPSEDALPDQSMILFLTHGHPEHIQGAVSHLLAERRHTVAIMGSSSICRYLKKRSSNRNDKFFEVKPGDVREFSGWRIEVFGWQHMPLFPPGWKAKAEYIGRLASHPWRLAGIGLRGLVGPRHAPMLGFRVTAEGVGRFVYFGEGLHRQTSQLCLKGGLGGQPLDALLSAVEPEDSRFLPSLMEKHSIRIFVAFEPHRVWREQFGLPQANLVELQHRLDGSGIRMWAPSPGEALRISQ